MKISKLQLKQLIHESLNDLAIEATKDQILGRGKFAPKKKMSADDAANRIIRKREKDAFDAALVGTQAFKPVSVIGTNRSKANKRKALLKKLIELKNRIKEFEDEIMKIAYGDHKYSDTERVKFFDNHQSREKRVEFIENFPESEEFWNNRSILRREFSELSDQLKKLSGLPDDF